MTRKIIFVGGIHGVGKTWLCQRLGDTMAIDHFSASQLIMNLKDDKSYDTNKSVKNISGNQDILLNAIKKYIGLDVPAVLDGHFCLLNSKHEIEQIPMETFIGIEPIAIIVLYDAIENISQKISGRDGIIYDYDLLSYFQDEEIKYSKYVAEYLRVPYLTFNMTEDIGDISNFIDKLQLGKDEK
jgi:adenylate kinase